MTTVNAVIPAASTWTREMIYSNPSRTIMSPNKALHGKPLPVPPEVRSFAGSPFFTPAFNAELARETKWTRVEQTSPEMVSEIRKAALTGQPCPSCRQDGNWVKCRGEVTGIEISLSFRCECGFWKWTQREIEKIPERFRRARLDTITPVGDHQTALLKELRERPSDSYLMHGSPGTGKTHFMYALYRNALEQSIREQYDRRDVRTSVWKTTASVLLNEHIAWDTRDVNDDNCAIPHPSVTTKMIEKAKEAGYRPALFLDEIDKLVVSDFKIKRLGEIVNAVYETGGQVVATSNKDVDTLISKWGADDALTILRRIGGGDNGHTLHFVSGPHTSGQKS